MNWLMPRYRDLLEPSRAGAATPEHESPADPYRGVALGVECAWPQAADREVARALS
jgi:hypothetical protein